MSNEDDVNDAAAKVGYKKPPKEHRFKPGQSGNVSGRPRKKAADFELGDVLDRFGRQGSRGRVLATDRRDDATNPVACVVHEFGGP